MTVIDRIIIRKHVYRHGFELYNRCWATKSITAFHKAK